MVLTSHPPETPPTTIAHEAEEPIVTRTSTKSRANRADTYLRLVKRHPLKSIRTDADLDAAQIVIDELLRQELDDGETAYLDALSDLVILYERDRHTILPLAPHELLAYLLEDCGMSQADLVRRTGIAKATVSDLVSAKRAFTVEQMHRVAKVVGLPATVFLPKAGRST